MTAEQVSEIKMQIQTSQLRIKSVLSMETLLIIEEITYSEDQVHDGGWRN